MNRPLLLAFGILFCANPVQALVPTGGFFMGIGHLDTQGPYSEANGISADGTVVVGSSALAPPDDPFDSGVQPVRWTLAEGMIRLNPAAHYLDSRATAASGDGSLIVGFVDTNRYRGFRWESSTGIEELPNPAGFDFDTYAWGISDDGSTIAGESASQSGEFQATIWKNDNVMGLGHLTPSEPFGSVTAANADGSVVIGGSSPHVFRWTTTTGMEALPNMPLNAYASAITSDGGVIVGAAVIGGVNQAFRWTEATGAVGLGVPNTVAYDVSADGNTIVGDLTIGGDSAFIWTPTTGLVDLKQYLFAQGIFEVDGWNLRSARGISADGLTIVGHGFNPMGVEEGWVARLAPTAIPEPSTIVLVFLATGMALVPRIRRSHG